MTAWWNGLNASERRTLSIGGIALVVILGYFLVWQPVHQESARLQEELRTQRALLAWAQPTVAEIRAMGGVFDAATEGEDGEDNGGQALFALADQHARQAGLGQVLRRVEPSGPTGARVVFEQIGFDELMRWLASLRDQHGIQANQVTLRRVELEGRVDAQILLEVPGA
ncbi:MAG: type II secretion system protein M [Aquisalimonadaceae bacterium]